MNSSANQISPIRHTSESLAHGRFFCDRQASLGRLLGFLENPVPDRPPAAGICRQRAGLRKVESWAAAAANRRANSSLVAWRAGAIDRLAEVPGIPGRTGWKARIKAIPTRA
jgi:hypothetical protein